MTSSRSNPPESQARRAVTASKLPVRKRRHLIPVRDSAVEAVWAWSEKNYWREVRDELNGGLHEVLASAHSDTGLTETTSTMRVFEVSDVA